MLPLRGMYLCYCKLLLLCAVGPATVRCNQATFTVAEGNSVDVCLELVLPVTATSLGCDVSASLSTIDGPLAGQCTYHMHGS